jgi:hypothetical protein
VIVPKRGAAVLRPYNVLGTYPTFLTG